MRKLLSMVLCLSMIISIFACVSVSANTETETETETETKTFELVAQGGEKTNYSMDGGFGELYASAKNQYVYYKFKIPKGAELTSADLTIHIADIRSKPTQNYTVDPYVVTDTEFWQDENTTLPEEVPTTDQMTKMSDAINMNTYLEGSQTVKELDISENEALKNTINTLVASGKEYVVIVITGSVAGTNANRVFLVNYFYTNYSGEKASLTATGTFEEVVDDFSDAVVGYDKETGAYTVETATTSGSAMLIVASFDKTGMVDAKVTTINANTAVNGTISGNMEVLEAGTSVKAFLWNPTTLAPIIDVIPIP